MSTDYEFTLFDADNHMYEPLESLTRHLPGDFQGPRGIMIGDFGGRKYPVVGGRVDTLVKNPTFDPIAKPGSLMKFVRGNPEGLTPTELFKDRERIRPGYRDANARLTIMDEQGVDQLWIFGTLGGGQERLLRHDPEAAAACAWAFNRWLDEDWGMAVENRIFTAPYISLADPAEAVKMLEWVIGRGAHLVMLTPKASWTSDGPKRPAEAVYDPFWQLAESSGITVAVHASPFEYTHNGYAPDDYTVNDQNDSSSWNALQHERPIFDFMAALIYDRLYERFPNIKVASIENGSDWVPELRRKIRIVASRRPGRFNDDPWLGFERCVWINPFWEDKIDDVLEWVGPDHVIFGSDWPHPEGLTTPRDYLSETKHLDRTTAEKVLGGNARGLNGTPVAA